MKKLLLTTFSLLFTLSTLLAQFENQGSIIGTIIEAESGFEVIGGNVLIANTATGTVTDLDGTYELKVEAGNYTIEVSYIGFATQQITDVIVKAGEVTSLDVQLGESAIELAGVEVVAKAFKDTEVAVLAIQKTSPVVLDGISSAQISKSGDSDVAGAVKRVTGVTVESGKYIYVRGLGDRYSKTTLNRAEIPGLDPNRNTVQMDLFPTNLVDNIIVYKTFSPNLPGDFAGGYVDIATKDFPEQFTFSASASLGFNALANLNKNVLSQTSSATEWLGFDNGARAIPELIQQNADNLPTYNDGISDRQSAQLLQDATAAFDNNWAQSNESKPLNASMSFSVGNQKQLFGKPLGIIAALSYQRNYTAYHDGIFGIFELTGDYDDSRALTKQVLLNDQKGTDETLWGAMLSTSYKLSPTNKINLMAMHNQSATATTRFAEGHKYNDDPSDIFQTRSSRFLERGLSTLQLTGKHVLTDWNNFEINWLSSYAISTQDDPDLRYFTNRISDNGNVFLKASSDRKPTRFYRDMLQNNWDNKLDFTLPFSQWNGLNAEIKTGLAFVQKGREFRENRYNFNRGAFLVENGNIQNYFAPQNLIQADPDANGYLNGHQGVYLVDNYDAKNNYNATQSVGAAYAMVQLPINNQLQIITGVRAEKTNVRLETFDTELTLTRYPSLDGQQDLINSVDFLPSLNVNYKLNDNMKLRAAYNRTIARPSFRELAPFASFAVDGGFVFVGNPDLQRTLIDNVDLRWEMYPNSGEIFSISAFYKNFTNPIERTFNPEAQNPELTLRNVEEAKLYGVEVEARKNLGFITNSLRHFSLGANFSYIYSQTKIDAAELEVIRATQPNAADTREMYGQAPYSINALLSYKNEKGTNANLSFNLVGARITTVTKGATPNYYQRPMPSLNFNISQKIGDYFKLKLSANNLLNAKYQETADFKGESFPISVYEIGQSFSLGFSYNLSK